MKQIEITAGLSLTERCNLKCKHCYIGQKELWKAMDYSLKEIPKEQITQLIPKLKRANVKRINLGGGETPLHPDFIDILQQLHDAEMKISLTTNGSTFHRYKNQLDLFNDIGVSIDFPDERHSQFRGHKKAFSRAINTLHELVNAGMKTELVTCIMSINQGCLPEIYELAKDIGVDMWRLNRFHSSKNDVDRFKDNVGINDAVCCINSNLSCTPEQMKKAFEYLASKTPKDQDYAIPDPVFRLLVEGNGVTKGTPYGKIAFRIKANGDITPNVFTNDSAGNSFEKEITEILRDKAFKSYQNREPKGKCTRCLNYDACQGGDLTDSYLLAGDLNAPDPFCFLEPSVKRNTSILSPEDTKFVHETYLGTIYVPIGRKEK